MKVIEYERASAISYARKWALSRNPNYYNFDKLGGDCTNFVSQCIFAGSNQMNFSKINGWYYNNLNDRSPAWTGVDFFYKFLTTNTGLGPYSAIIDKSQIMPADIIILGKNNSDLYHSLIVTNVINNEILVASHTFDTLDRPLSSYNFNIAKYLKIKGVRTN